MHVMCPVLTDGGDIGDNFTVIGVTGAIFTLLFVTITTIGVVLLIIIVYQKKSVKKDFVEPIYDIPEPLSNEHVSKCNIPMKEVQKQEMHQYDVVDSGLSKCNISSEKIQKEDMQYNVAYSGLPNNEIQKEEMQPNVAYGVCRV